VFERVSGQPLTTGVPGLFTYDGYHKAFLKEAEKVAQQLADEEPWVLGIAERQQSSVTDARAAQRVTGQVRRLYLEDYARTWEKMIADIQLIRPRSLQQSVQMARILSAPDSPLPLLMRALVRETTLGEKQEEQKTVVDRAGDRVRGAQEELRKILGGTAPQTASTPDARLESIVDDRFDGLRRFVRAPAPGQPAPIDTALALINELYTLLTATESAVAGGMGPPQSDVPNKVKAEAGRMPEPMRSLLQTLLSTGTSLALGATRSNLSASLAAAIGDFCPKAINNRYPFSPRSALDVTQEDFARLFSPGGLLDEFFQKNLSQYVDKSGRVWTFKPTGGASMGDSGTLVQFQRAAVIRDVFFQGGAKTASLRLDFKPLEMDAAITQLILDVDGQLVKYSHGPQVRQSVQWPGPRGSTQVRLHVSPAPAAGAAGMLFEGPWALFRLFDRAQIMHTGQPERFRVSFTVDQRKAWFEVTATSVQNPFRLKEIEQFQCPSRL
jgi:type VI secretion system protein ImpL